MTEREQALLTATRAVLNASDTLQIILQILASSRELLHAEAGSLFLVNPRKRVLEMAAATNLPQKLWKTIQVPFGQGVSGWVAQHATSALVEDISQDPRHFRAVDEQTGFRTRGYMSVPLTVNGKVIGTLQLLNQSHGGRFTEEDLKLLEGFAVIAALAINKHRMHKSALEKERMEAELTVAEAFQRRLLPEDFHAPDGLDVQGFHHPARSLGGDLYDGFPTDKGFTFLIGDVSGKGPGAAIWMSGFSSAVRLLAGDGHDLLDNLPLLDRHMTRLLPAESFLTLFLGRIKDNELHYSSAGHNSMLLLPPDGNPKWLESNGLPIGMMPDFPRDQKHVPFPVGSRLVLFTDGISEAENPNEEMYGEERLLAVVKRNRHLDGEQLVKRIVQSVRRFCTGAEQSDDITLLLLTNRGRNATLQTQ